MEEFSSDLRNSGAAGRLLLGEFLIVESAMTAVREPQNTHLAIMWFRDDLRVSDNAALCAAGKTGAPLLCIYIFDEQSKGFRSFGGASRWWLRHSLAALGEHIENFGSRVDFF